MPSYLVISPVKDEEQYVEATLASMVAQTVRPARWIIVDDGSADRTVEIVAQYCRQHDWISLVRLPRRTHRGAGAPVIRAFHAGLEQAGGTSYDFIVKLDCDLRLPPDYFECLLGRFEADPQLGIASGVYRELSAGTWKTIGMPDYHAAGASKVIRARCFEQIGGFVEARGWDTVDEIRAQMRGWRTRHFEDLPFDHLRVEGSARGPLYTARLHGEVYYLTGGSWCFFLVKTVHRMITGRPPFFGGLMLLVGFLGPFLTRRRRVVNRDEARHYQRMLNQRIWSTFSEVTGRLAVRLYNGRPA